MYLKNLHQNSNEFKQLGTLHKENRMAEYLPGDRPLLSKLVRPVQNDTDPNTLLKSLPDGAKNGLENVGDSNSENMSIKLDTKYRQAALKHLIGERLRQENLRSLAINQELQKMRGALSPQNYSTGRQFPVTTNQEFINQE